MNYLVFPGSSFNCDKVLISCHKNPYIYLIYNQLDIFYLI